MSRLEPVAAGPHEHVGRGPLLEHEPNGSRNPYVLGTARHARFYTAVTPAT